MLVRVCDHCGTQMPTAYIGMTVETSDLIGATTKKVVHFCNAGCLLRNLNEQNPQLIEAVLGERAPVETLGVVDGQVRVISTKQFEVQPETGPGSGPLSADPFPQPGDRVRVTLLDGTVKTMGWGERA